MSANGEAPLWAVVLAGGAGTRFWPASRPERPKQLLPLGRDGRPLVADAVERARRVAGEERVRVVAGAHLLGPLREVLPGVPRERFLVEPRPRGTGPALAWAAHRVARADRDAVMVSLHADHRISPEEAFEETVARAVRAAREGERLFCLGVRPSRPETGYGYIRLGGRLSESVFVAEEFVEKPDRETARRYLESGEYLWNTGLFVWRADAFLDAVREHAPEIGTGLDRLDADDPEGFFDRVERVAVDVAVLERARGRVGAVEASFRWDDLGVWTSLARAFPSDAQGNTVLGPARAVDAGGNIVWSEDGRITLFGVEELVVVRSGGETLVTTRELASALKELLERLEDDAEE